MLRKFVLNSRFYVFSAYLPSVLSIFTLPIITPYLSLEDYGIYGLVYAVYSFISIVFNLGFILEYQNSFFNENGTYRNTWSRTLGFQFCWNLIVSVPLGIVIMYLISGKVTTGALWTSVISLLITFLVFEPIKSVGAKLLQYTDRHKHLFYVNFIATVLQYVFVVVAIVYFHAGFVAWFLGNLLNAIIVASVLMFFLISDKITPHFNFSWLGVKNRIRKQTAIVFHNLSGYILETSDRLLLNFFKVPIDQIGIYNVCYNYANYGQTVNTAFNTVFSPTYLKAVKQGDDANIHNEVKRLMKFWIGIVIFIIINMIVWAEYLFKFLYRNEKFDSIFYLAFPIIVTLIYRPFYVAVVDNLIIQSRFKTVASMTGIAALVNLILNLIFIPFFGIKAAVYSTAVCYSILGFVGFLLPQIKSQLTRTYINRSALYLVLSLILVFTIGYLDVSKLFIKVLLSLFSVVILAYYSKITSFRSLTRVLKRGA